LLLFVLIMTAAASRLDLDADHAEMVRVHLSLFVSSDYSTVTNQDWCPAQAVLRLDDCDVLPSGGR
jgi:hypothetical protein